MFSIYTVFPRWFCAWVFRAVSMLNDVVATYGAPIYVNHEIIHNKFIVSYFEKKWVIFEHDLDKIPEWSIVVLSAHWVGPSFYLKLKERKLRYIDATCPLVQKVHKEAMGFIWDWYNILYIGKHDHQEALWVQDFAPDKIMIVSSKDEVDIYFKNQLSSNMKIALLTQTTLSVDDTKELIQYIQDQYPSIVLPKAWDICYATTNRQNAVRKLCEVVDTVLIVWSKNSSNSNKLVHLAHNLWKEAFLIDDATQIEESMLYSPSIWVSAGASWPEELVQEVVEKLEWMWWKFIEEVRVIEEKITFPYILEIKN